MARLRLRFKPTRVQFDRNLSRYSRASGFFTGAPSPPTPEAPRTASRDERGSWGDHWSATRAERSAIFVNRPPERLRVVTSLLLGGAQIERETTPVALDFPYVKLPNRHRSSSLAAGLGISPPQRRSALGSY